MSKNFKIRIEKNKKNNIIMFLSIIILLIINLVKCNSSTKEHLDAIHSGLKIFNMADTTTQSEPYTFKSIKPDFSEIANIPQDKGLAAADKICNLANYKLKYSGTYKALLGLEGQRTYGVGSVGSVLKANTNYVRAKDGVHIATTNANGTIDKFMAAPGLPLFDQVSETKYQINVWTGIQKDWSVSSSNDKDNFLGWSTIKNTGYIWDIGNIDEKNINNLGLKNEVIKEVYKEETTATTYNDPNLDKIIGILCIEQ